MYVNCFYNFNEGFCKNGNAIYIYAIYIYELYIYIYESSYMYTKTVLTPTLVSVS